MHRTPIRNAYAVFFILSLYCALLEAFSALFSSYLPIWFHWCLCVLLILPALLIGIITWINRIRSYNDGN